MDIVFGTNHLLFYTIFIYFNIDIFQRKIVKLMFVFFYFRYALLYSLLVSLGWLVYTLAEGIKESSVPIETCIALICHAILMMACLLATHSRRRARFVAVAAALGLIILSLTLAALNTFNKLHR